MSKFTSGTWSVGIDVKCGPYIYADDGEAIIAVIRNCGHISESNKKETVRQANARLIAAAPEMYELLFNLFNVAEYISPLEITNARMRWEELLARINGEGKIERREKYE